MNKLKNELRAQLRREYSAMESGYKKNSDLHLISQLELLPIYIRSKRIFMYASVGYEVNTLDLIRRAHKDGKTVLLPICQGKGVMDYYEYSGELMEGKFGIPEPTGTHCFEAEATDLMIVPGLSFTADGRRLGQGGGYYDRYLAKHPCITMGLCRDRFLAKELPSEWNDLPVDFVITESSVYECKNGAS